MAGRAVEEINQRELLRVKLALGAVGVDDGDLASGNAMPVNITDGGGTVNTRTVGSAVVAGDVGLITHSMIHGQTTGGGGGYVDVKVTPSGALATAATIANGDDVALGATTDAAVSTDATGTVSGKLRGIVKILASVWNSAKSRLTIGGSLGAGDLVLDAWGVQKMSLPYSVYHGMWTFDIPASLFFMYENGTQVYTSTNIVSTGGAAVLTTSATKTALILEGRDSPRYQPNRGHLFSTALWCPSKTANGIREWGVQTADSGVFFRLKADGLLYAVMRSGGTETMEQVITTTAVAGFDVQKGNVYDIQYQWRGVGNYYFFVNLVLVHTFANLGTLTALSMENPAIPASFKATRTTADVALYLGCVDITSENGSDDALQPRVAYANISRNGTDVPVISIFNPLTINTRVNTRTIYPNTISFSCDKKAIFKIWKHRDPALLTGETFVALGTGSYVQTDSPDTVAGAVAATAATVTGMELIDVVNLQANASAISTIRDRRINFTLVRGDYLTITVTALTGLCDVVISWGEAV